MTASDQNPYEAPVNRRNSAPPVNPCKFLCLLGIVITGLGLIILVASIALSIFLGDFMVPAKDVALPSLRIFRIIAARGSVLAFIIGLVMAIVFGSGWMIQSLLAKSVRYNRS